MRTPICWKCQIEMRPLKNGVTLVEMADFGPSALWQADLYRCPLCGIKVVVSLGNRSWSYHTDVGFDRLLAQAELDTTYTRRIWLNQAAKENTPS